MTDPIYPDLNTNPNNCVIQNSLSLSGYGVGLGVPHSNPARSLYFCYVFVHLFPCQGLFSYLSMEIIANLVKCITPTCITRLFLYSGCQFHVLRQVGRSDLCFLSLFHSQKRNTTYQ